MAATANAVAALLSTEILLALNPVEAIWLRLKGQIAANRLYGSMQMLLDGVHAFFQAIAPEHALR